MSDKLTNAQVALLTAAATRQDRCLTPPAARAARTQKIGEKLLALEFVREVKAKRGAPVWRRASDTGTSYSLKLTAAGMKAIRGGAGKANTDLQGPNANDGESDVTRSTGDALPHERLASEHAAELASPPPPATENLQMLQEVRDPPRPGSKIAHVLALLEREEGASLSELIAATNWLPHTTRAALTGLRKRGYAVAPDRADRMRGSVYRIEHSPDAVGANDGAMAIKAP
jgi:hypothetical protein